MGHKFVDMLFHRSRLGNYNLQRAVSAVKGPQHWPCSYGVKTEADGQVFWHTWLKFRNVTRIANNPTPWGWEARSVSEYHGFTRFTCHPNKILPRLLK